MNPMRIAGPANVDAAAGSSPNIANLPSHKEAIMKHICSVTLKISVVCLFVLALTTSRAAAELTYVGNQGLNQNNTGINLIYAEYGDEFGYALAVGDFNGDGYGDLAVGTPSDYNQYKAGVRDSGSVAVFYGTASGYRGTGNQMLDGSLGSHSGDRFGHAMAAGDFNRDGFSDLAVGVPFSDYVPFPGDNSGEKLDAGMVSVYYGAATGLVTSGYVDGCHFPLHMNQNAIGKLEAGDRFGHSLASGDFDGDGNDDLAIGVPYEDIGSIRDAGAIHIVYGSTCKGLTASGYDTYHQNTAGIKGGAEPGDLFGWSLAAGDFDNGNPRIKAYDDLAVGIPLEDIGSTINTGMVQILYGASDGLSSRDQTWHQDTSGIQGGCEHNDLFGYSLAVGKFDTDYPDDLAIGIPYEDIGNITDAGMVQILYGSYSGGLTSRDQILHQNNIGSQAEAHDRFGWSLATGRFNATPGVSLAVGVPYEDLGGITDAGVVHVLYSNSGSFNSFQLWHQNSYGVVDRAESQDRFGWALASGAIKPGPYLDLAVGVPGETVSYNLRQQGMVNVLYNNQ